MMKRKKNINIIPFLETFVVVVVVVVVITIWMYTRFFLKNELCHYYTFEMFRELVGVKVCRNRGL